VYMHARRNAKVEQLRQKRSISQGTFIDGTAPTTG
jgi:hypothetical protein